MTARSGIQGSSGEIPSLNGLRAISVAIVVLSHAGFERLVPGGLGVTIFFFLSGYLITTLLLREQARFGSIDIQAFYVRRFLRLMPPLLVTLAIAYGLTYSGILPGNITLEGIAAQLFYFANYLEIFFEGSEKIPTGTGGLWSLAVEEHFYLVFPVLMSLGLAAGVGNRSKALIAAGLCLLVLLWRMYLVYGLGVPEMRTHFASDTRIDSIAYGCILALLAWSRNQHQPPGGSLTLREYAALAAGGLLLVFTFAYRDPQFRETVRYSIQGIALMPIFYLAIKRHDCWLFAILNNRIAVRVGIYSYSIYLIHRVVIVALIDNIPALADRPVALAALAFGLSTLFAAGVDRFVDGYFRRYRAARHRAIVVEPVPPNPATA